MRRSFALVAALALLTACGGGGSATTTTPAATTSAAGSATTTVPADATITIAGFSFGDPITVAVGDTVAVVNQDGVSHTWTSDDGLFDSGSLSRGETFTQIFDQAGEYEFFCSIHPQMEGSITVEG